MNPKELFLQTKIQILNNKRAYTSQHLQQLQNSITIARMDNIHLKQKLEQLKKQLKSGNNTQKANHGSNIETYKRQEREKIQKLQQLSKLINEYKQLCQKGIQYTSSPQSLNKEQSQDQNENSLNLSHTVVKIGKKIKTHIFCQPCERQFLPQQYYLHCQEHHQNTSAFKSLHN